MKRVVATIETGRCNNLDDWTEVLDRFDEGRPSQALGRMSSICNDYGTDPCEGTLRALTRGAAGCLRVDSDHHESVRRAYAALREFAHPRACVRYGRSREEDDNEVEKLLYDIAGVPLPEVKAEPAAVPEPVAPKLTSAQTKRIRALSARDTARLAHAAAAATAAALAPGIPKIAAEHLAGSLWAFLRTGASRDDRAALRLARDHFDQIRARSRTPWPESYDAPWWAVESLVGDDSDANALTFAILSAADVVAGARSSRGVSSRPTSRRAWRMVCG